MNEIAALLRDFGQGASNAAASNVSGPVDLLAWALRKGGVPVPSNPILGSEWMRQKGLLADPRNKIAGLLGEAAGLSAPIAAAAKAPQIARGLLAADDTLTAGANRMADHFERTGAAFKGPPNQRGAIVWHGSPHKFDAFDASKIGTGEGAQAYGHGLYLADAPDVAKQYADNVKDMGAVQNINAELSRLAKIMSADEIGYRNYKSDVGRNAAAAYDALMAQRDGVRTAAGNLYKVDLPDEKIARMLDWDKPLSQQTPEVQAAFRKQGISGKSWDVQAMGDGPQGYLNDRLVFDNAFEARKKLNELRSQGYYARPYGDAMGRNKTGAEFVRDINDPAQQSERLRQMGIPGIRYLDGGSRGAGTGTSNYVVFPGEESALRILERNGNPINALVQALKGPR